jgi:hypothetical protein
VQVRKRVLDARRAARVARRKEAAAAAASRISAVRIQAYNKAQEQAPKSHTVIKLAETEEEAEASVLTWIDTFHAIQSSP